MRYEVIDTQASVAIELRRPSTAVNPRYQVRNRKTNEIVDEFTTKASAVSYARDLNREWKKDRDRKLAAIGRLEKNVERAANLLDEAHVALTAAFGAYELDEGLRMESARLCDDADRSQRQIAQRAEYMRARLTDGD